MARFLAVFGEGKSGGKKIGERKGFQLIEVIWEVPKTGRECQKFSFWQDGDIFGRIFGRCLMIEMAEMPRNKGVRLYGGCQKFNFWQDRGMFLAFWKRFLADYICKIARKPINRAFVGVSVECQKFWIWQDGKVFGSGFITGWRKTTRTVSFCQKQEYP